MNQDIHSVILKPRTFWERVAYIVSQLGSPPVMGLLAIVLITVSLALPGAWLWFGVYLVSAMLLPLGFLIWQVRRGHVTDMDIHLREQRAASLLVTIAGFGIAWLTMVIGRAPTLMTVIAGAWVLQWAAIFLVTLRWKISVHSTSATGIALLILYVFGRSALPVALSIPLVVWSRVKLRHHTLTQTLAGVLLGSAVFGLVVLLGA